MSDFEKKISEELVAIRQWIESSLAEQQKTILEFNARLDIVEKAIIGLEEAGKVSDELVAQVASLEDIIDKLAEKPVTKAAPSTAKLKGIRYKVGKNEYTCRYPVIHHKGKDYTEEDLLANLSVVKDLVEGGSRAFELVKPSKLFL